jgi:hypothetical protein
MIIVVADAFSEQYTGGAELTTDALLSSGFYNYKKILSPHLTKKHVETYKNERWVFGNFANVNKDVLLEVIKTVANYSVIEYDYKFCKYRLQTKHEKIDGHCSCSTSPHGKLVGIFYAKAKNLFYMSTGQQKEYEKKFPFLKKSDNGYVLSSTFSDETLDYISSLDTSKKDDTYIILQSNSWVKGVQDCVEYAKNNKLKYELVGGLPYKKMLEKLASSKGLIFLPSGFDTCPRLTIEAKLLDCDLIINDNVQHKSEPWFDNKASILKYFSEQKKKFFEMCLDYRLAPQPTTENTSFHFIIPGYNASKWLPYCINSIKRQEYNNYTVTFIDDVSTDNSVDVFKRLTEDDSRFKVIKNKKKKYALRNIEESIELLQCDKNDVIIILDADDWLASSSVLTYLSLIYETEGALGTYGSYMYYPLGIRGVEPSEYPEDVIVNNKFREDAWRASHLRTFKKEVWDKIDKKDFIDVDGDHYHMAYDQAIMLPVLEMCRERVKYIDKILHVYNRANPLNVDKIKQQQQHAAMKRIRAGKRYGKKQFSD